MRDVLADPVALNVEEFSLLWRTAGFADPPPALPIRYQGRTAAARGLLRARVTDGLRARGLGTVDSPAEPLAGMLALLAAPQRCCCTIAVGAQTWQAVSAAAGGSAVLAESVAEEVRLSPIEPSSLVRAALRGVPAAQAGPGRTANLGLAQFRRACDAGTTAARTGFLAELHNAGLRPPEAHTVLRAVTDRRGGGQLGASLRGRDGALHRTGAMLSWVDTEAGRYALLLRDGWLTITPADAGKLAAMSAELFDR